LVLNRRYLHWRWKAGLESIADPRGIIAARDDQRSALRSCFGQWASKQRTFLRQAIPIQRGGEFDPDTRAILLIRNMVYPQLLEVSRKRGSLLAYEQTGYDKNVPGRFPRLLDGWSVRARSRPAQRAVKLLCIIRRSSAEINGAKYSFVEVRGYRRRCAFLPELVSYAENMGEKGTSSFGSNEPWSPA
jgi:tagatose 1,6-diphosphate aldolase